MIQKNILLKKVVREQLKIGVMGPSAANSGRNISGPRKRGTARKRKGNTISMEWQVWSSELNVTYSSAGIAARMFQIFAAGPRADPDLLAARLRSGFSHVI